MGAKKSKHRSSSMDGGRSSQYLGQNDVLKFYELTGQERQEIIAHWPDLIEKYPDLIFVSWHNSLMRSSAIREVFGVEEMSKAAEHPTLSRVIDSVQSFFHKIIVVLKLEQEPFMRTCMDLGARHIQLANKGFLPIHLDIFMVCMIETTQHSIIDSEPAGSKRNELILAWQKLLRAVIEYMRIGYKESVPPEEGQHNLMVRKSSGRANSCTGNILTR